MSSGCCSSEQLSTALLRCLCHGHEAGGVSPQLATDIEKVAMAILTLVIRVVASRIMAWQSHSEQSNLVYWNPPLCSNDGFPLGRATSQVLVYKDVSLSGWGGIFLSGGGWC